MRRVRVAAVAFVAVVGAAIAARSAWALDPPHSLNSTPSISCNNCHMSHHALGDAITNRAGNTNLCITCHTPGGAAASKPFADTDEAIPGTSGTSHRWDSGASGWVKPNTPNGSTGTVQSGGAFTGPYAKTYTIAISLAGAVGTARFNWTATTPGGGSGTNLVTGANVVLDQGITVTFTNGASGTSFVVGDQWSVYVRTDINQPTDPAMAPRLSSAKIVCSTCHQQHLQVATPFDPNAPPYAGSGTGAGRHFQRIDDDINQMCIDCHSVRNVTSSSQGSHPVGVTIPTSGPYKPH